MKKIAQLLAVSAVLLYGSQVESGYSGYMTATRNSSLNEMQERLQIVFSDVEQLEYANDQFDTMSLISSCESGDLTVSQKSIDLSVVGDHEIEYTLTDTDIYGQSVTKTFTKTVRVADTAAPVIQFSKDKVEVAINNSFDATANILSVSDAVDGQLVKAGELTEGTYTVKSNVNTKKIGTYKVTVEALDIHGNRTAATYTVEVNYGTYDHVWDGTKLTKSRGTILGPSGKETYYNLPMGGVIAIMRRMGNNDKYWIRSDGVKMLGKYVMVAANLNVHPRGSLVMTSLGMGIVCDTGAFAQKNVFQLDIAVNW